VYVFNFKNKPEINFWFKIQNSNKYLKSRNVVSCDELIYQPPNKVMKYDDEIISAEPCNSDENSIG